MEKSRFYSAKQQNHEERTTTRAKHAGGATNK